MVEERLKALNNGLRIAQGRREEVRRSLRDARSAVTRIENEAQLLDHVAALLHTLIDGEITEGVKAIETLQSEGVRAVFNDQDLTVRADVEVSRGKVNVSLVTSQRKENGDLIEGLALDGFGGAVSTVQSILLRLAIIFRRGLRPVLFLDETLPAFDDRYVHNMAAFLKTLCKRLGVDILLVTHNPALVDAGDRAYRIRRDKGFCTFQRITQ
jgi:ABC-type nitrate/sulfonate/bicarbonate transport system ATPase subunit